MTTAMVRRYCAASAMRRNRPISGRRRDSPSRRSRSAGVRATQIQPATASASSTSSSPQSSRTQSTMAITATVSGGSGRPESWNMATICGATVVIRIAQTTTATTVTKAG